jgi:hypothetical protein
VAQSKRQNQIPTEPKAWWQRAIAGERLPEDLFEPKSKCQGTIEEQRAIALDVRELIRKRVFEHPVGSVFHLNIAFSWLREMRLNADYHRPHHHRATGFGELRRHRLANEAAARFVGREA